MRSLVLAVGGPLRADENRKRWFERVAQTAGISPSMARKAYRGYLRDPEHKTFWLLREAARREQQGKYHRLSNVLAAAAQELDALDSIQYGQAISSFVSAARELRNLVDKEK